MEGFPDLILQFYPIELLFLRWENGAHIMKYQIDFIGSGGKIHEKQSEDVGRACALQR